MKPASISVSSFLLSMLSLVILYTFTLCVDTYCVQKLVTIPSNEMAAVNVQCFFAVNAPAQGCLVIFGSISLTFNETIVRFDNAPKVEKAVTIPNTLPSNMPYILFNVAAYDYYINQEVNFSKPAAVNQAVNFSKPAALQFEEFLLSFNPAVSTTSSQRTQAISFTPTCM